MSEAATALLSAHLVSIFGSRSAELIALACGELLGWLHHDMAAMGLHATAASLLMDIMRGNRALCLGFHAVASTDYCRSFP